MEKKENTSKIKKEKGLGGFRCCGCEKWVEFSDSIGTAHRNHCPRCLSSKHLDCEFSGDRASECGGCMRPIGLTFKKEGLNKYGKKRKGELMVIHKCVKCGGISINRLAADDDEGSVLGIFSASKDINNDDKKNLLEKGINVLGKEDKKDVFTGLFGKGVEKF